MKGCQRPDDFLLLAKLVDFHNKNECFISHVVCQHQVLRYHDNIFFLILIYGETTFRNVNLQNQ
jgi:hypothetical protein